MQFAILIRGDVGIDQTPLEKFKIGSTRTPQSMLELPEGIIDYSDKSIIDHPRDITTFPGPPCFENKGKQRWD